MPGESAGGGKEVSKTLIIALVLLMLTVLVMLFNARGSVDLNLLFDTFSVSKALVFLGFTSVGVVVGLLLK
jgi:uncharacterized integral membrane protein